MQKYPVLFLSFFVMMLLAGINFAQTTSEATSDSVILDTTHGYTGGCDLTDTSDWTIDNAVPVSLIQVWYNWEEGESSISYTLTKDGADFASGTMERADCDTYQANWCNGNAPLSQEFPPGQYELKTSSAKMCTDGTTGTVRLFGTGSPKNEKNDVDRNPSSGPCSSDYDCPSSYSCDRSTGRCVWNPTPSTSEECSSDADCASGYSCQSGKCVWNPEANAPEANVTTTCATSSDCGEGKVCSVCGQCMNGEDAVSLDEVTVKFDITADEQQVKIKNIINNSAIFRVYVTPELEANGQSLSYCDLAQSTSTKEVLLSARIADSDVYAGFTAGHIDDARAQSKTCKIDLSADSTKCIFVVSPNDRKKLVGAVGEVTQNIELSLIQGDETTPQQTGLTVLLEPSGPTVSFDLGGTQVQEEASKVIHLSVNDPDTRIVKISARVVPFGTLFVADKGSVLSQATVAQDQLYFATEKFQDVSIGYQAPKLGNFNIGQELQSISMWDLQKEAGKTIAQDVFFASIDKGLEAGQKATETISATSQAAFSGYQKYIKMHPELMKSGKATQLAITAKQGKKMEQDVNNLIDAYKVGKGYVIDDPNIYSGTQDLTKGMKTNVEDTSNKATTTEKVANLGVSAINLMQMGVGVLTYLPNKIPGAGKLTAGVQASFSAASNIWKANLQYIAKDEKLNRAEELFVPVMIAVTTEDLSGWQTTAVVTLQVAYQKV